MSYKYQADPVTSCHYVLPRIGAMQSDIHAFLSEELYERTTEAEWRQAVDAASYPGVKGVYLLPDTHLGANVPIGSVIVTEDTLIQAASGYDISCGVVYLRTDLHARDVASRDKRVRWVKEVEKRVATGLGSYRPPEATTFSATAVGEILRYGAKPLGVQADQCERQYIPVGELEGIEAADAKAASQLGSVGGGNHFVELQADVADGSVWAMIHCGSRGYGYQTAREFFYRGAELRQLPTKRRERSWLRIEEPLGKLYWAHHNAAANYAIANRHIITQGVQEALRRVWKGSSEVYYEISHNLIQHETLVLPDGGTTTGFVHRKGATRAFPAGHPDLVGTRWEDTGHPCLIPGSMYDGAAILFPAAQSPISACSVNHGSGRRMARGEAKRKLAAKQPYIDEQMRTVTRKLGGVVVRGIVGNFTKTPLDECRHVYKDLDQVLGVLTSEGIATVDRRLYPVANLKGTD